MKNRDGLETSDNWGTPKSIYDPLNDVYHFDFDPCPLNHDITKWNGLTIGWGASNFVNPPYNRVDKPKFIDKSFSEYSKGKIVALLIPASTGTKQFHKLIAKECKIRLTWNEWYPKRFELEKESMIIFVEGRIAFEGINTKGVYSTRNKGKHDSMIVILNEKNRI